MVDSDQSVGRREVLGSLGAAGAAALAGCSGGDGDGTPTDGGGGGTATGTPTSGNGGQETVKAAWLYISSVGDLGWSFAHDQARKVVDEKYDWLETEYTESVAPSDSSRVFEQYAQGDVDIVFGTTFGYMDPMATIAKKYPDTYFEHATGYRTLDNMGRYMGRIYQPRYLAGQAAGMVTETNNIGYVGAYPIPEVVRSINSMALGARSVNPEATFKVRWVNAWFDPPTSREAANALIDSNCDVIAMEQDSPAAVKAANSAGVWASGYNADMEEFGGDNYLVSPIWHWEKFYGPTLEAVHNGTWEADSFWGGMETGVPALDDWGPNVPQDVKDQVASTKDQILNDELDVWSGSKFEGESDEFLFQQMSSFVEGVEGTVPE